MPDLPHRQDGVLLRALQGGELETSCIADAVDRVMGGLLAVARFAAIPPGAGWPWLLLVLLFGFGLLGLVVAMRDCLACVSRLFGGI